MNQTGTLVLRIMATGPNTFAGSTCDGLYGANGQSLEDVVTALRQRLPANLSSLPHVVQLVPPPKPEQTEWLGGELGAQHSQLRRSA